MPWRGRLSVPAMAARKVLCIAPGRRPTELDTQLREQGWEVIWADDLATARRLQSQLQLRLCLLLIDRVNLALTAQIESAVRSITDLEWVAAVPPGALELPAFRDLLLDAFLDFHVGPIQADSLLPMLAYAHRRSLLRASLRDAETSETDAELGLVGRSAAMTQLRRQIVKLAATDAPVLIDGERGTGKELVAQAIHREGPRGQADRPFVAINCGAIAESLLESELFGHEEGAFTGARRGGHAGLFEAAHRGTLFLDEIGEMPLLLQTRLLRVLEEREVMRVGGTRPVPIDVRVICATHCDLDARVREGRFRPDLFYRLAVLRLSLPPLRARAGDAVKLLEWSLKTALAALGARPHPNLAAELAACRKLLEAYAWPGNVREVRNLAERLALFLAAEPLQALTGAFLLAVAPELTGAVAAAPTLADVVAQFGGNRDAAARHLGISRTTLWRRLRAGE